MSAPNTSYPATEAEFEEWTAHHIDCTYRAGICQCEALKTNEDDRWRKAEALNERPDTCWASLVSWALWGDADGIFDQSICIAPGDERCYCGKLPVEA